MRMSWLCIAAEDYACQAFKGSAGGKKSLPGVPRTVPQEQMGAPRRLAVSPAKRLRIGSPFGGASHPHQSDELRCPPTRSILIQSAAELGSTTVVWPLELHLSQQILASVRSHIGDLWWPSCR